MYSILGIRPYASDPLCRRLRSLYTKLTGPPRATPDVVRPSDQPPLIDRAPYVIHPGDVPGGRTNNRTGQCAAPFYTMLAQLAELRPNLRHYTRTVYAVTKYEVITANSVIDVIMMGLLISLISSPLLLSEDIISL